MQKENLLDHLIELKDRFKSFFQHKKKVTALENFSDTDGFGHRPYLDLVKHCMHQGFLGEKESDFLDHMLSRYEINYLDWSHRTKWLKGEIAKNRKAAEPIQTYFQFTRQSTPVHVPVQILNNTILPVGKRI